MWSVMTSIITVATVAAVSQRFGGPAGESPLLFGDKVIRINVK